VQADNITARFNNGVLTIEVPRSARPEPRWIEVQPGERSRQESADASGDSSAGGSDQASSDVSSQGSGAAKSEGSGDASGQWMRPLVRKLRPPRQHGEQCGRPPSAAFRHHGPVSYGALGAGWHRTMSEVAGGDEP
jgi:hypothetical protein